MIPVGIYRRYGISMEIKPRGIYRCDDGNFHVNQVDVYWEILMGRVIVGILK